MLHELESDLKEKKGGGGNSGIVKPTERHGSVGPIFFVSNQECHSCAQCFMKRDVLSEG